MKRPMPAIKIVLMTHTAQLATLPGGAQYSEWSKTGTCRPAPLPRHARTAPKAIYDGLWVGMRARLVVPPTRSNAHTSTTSSVSIPPRPRRRALPATGMEYYQRARSTAVYHASKRGAWPAGTASCSMHTHVGEGARDRLRAESPRRSLGRSPTSSPASATRTNAAQAQTNISTLLGAIRRFETTHRDAGRYVIFRLAHATWATPSQAQAMHDAGVEADVNLESNVATGAYPVARMPLGADAARESTPPLAQIQRPTSS